MTIVGSNVQPKKSRRLTFEIIKTEFEAKGCTLLSSEYKNAKTKLSYLCPFGHNEAINYDNFKTGYGCRKCYGKRSSTKQRLSFDVVRETFVHRGFVLLSTEEDYNNNLSKMFYLCPQGHYHFVRYGDFAMGKGCPYCRNEKLKEARSLGIDFIKNVFQSRGFTLLSTEYKGANYKYEYICPNGHQGAMTYGNFSVGHGLAA